MKTHVEAAHLLAKDGLERMWDSKGSGRGDLLGSAGLARLGYK